MTWLSQELPSGLNLPKELLIEIASYFKEWIPHSKWNNDDNLRPTSKIWQEAATFYIVWPICRWPSSKAFETSIPNGILSTSTTLGQNVEKLRVEFSDRWLDDHMHPFDYPDIDPFLRSNQQDNDGLLQQAWFLIENLPDILKSLPKLKYLRVETQIWRSEKRHKIFEPDLDCLMLGALTQSLVDGLPYCKGLTPLELRLPCTHDFAILSETLPDSFFKHIKHICVAVSDASGENGDREYTDQIATGTMITTDLYPACRRYIKIGDTVMVFATSFLGVQSCCL